MFLATVVIHYVIEDRDQSSSARVLSDIKRRKKVRSGDKREVNNS